MEIKGYPNYLIYPDGKVFSNKERRGFMKPHKHKDGYYFVSIEDIHNNKKTYSVHRLLAQHYIPNPENKCEVDHIDRNPLNNDISNLRWVTPCENCQNKGIYQNNKSGIKNISYHNKTKLWRYEKTINKIKFKKMSQNKNIVLWCKFVYELKISQKPTRPLS